MFRVRVAEKTRNHPWYGKGSSLCYVIDGEESKELRLMRGAQYRFSLEAEGHPFYLSSSEEGAGEGSLMGMMKPVERGNLDILVSSELPERMYYQCHRHLYMGGRVRVVPHESIHLTPFSGDMVAPLSIVQRKGDDAWYIADQIGVVYRVEGKKRTVYLDIRDKVVNLDREYDERGLLDIAFDPSGGNVVYVFYSAGRDSLYENRIARYTGDEEEILLRIEKEEKIHNGGRMAFGRDGYLYIGIGDGGPQKDPQGHAQDLSVLSGKILRIDVGDKKGYKIPKENPYVGKVGVREEIYCSGFRNPWGISFDSSNRCFVVDVGYNDVEEVNILERGGNYGWNMKEGTRLTGFSSLRGIRVVDPIWEYTHDWLIKRMGKKGGIAVIGGYYLDGYGYVFGDYAGVIMRIDLDSRDNKWKLVETVEIGKEIHAFGLDRQNRLFVMTKGKEGGMVYEVLL